MPLILGEQVVRYPEFSFGAMGTRRGGRVVTTDYFEGGSIRIVLEMTPGDESSRVELWVQSQWLKRAIRDAFRSVGARRPEVGADLTVTWTGWNDFPHVWLYEATYARPEGEH